MLVACWSSTSDKEKLLYVGLVCVACCDGGLGIKLTFWRSSAGVNVQNRSEGIEMGVVCDGVGGV